MKIKNILGEGKTVSKKIWIPAVCCVAVLAAGGVLWWSLRGQELDLPSASGDVSETIPQGETEYADAVITDPEKDRGRFTGYTHVVVAPNTPAAVLTELEQYGIKPIKHKNNQALFAPGNPQYLAQLGKSSKVYLCEGNYKMENGAFVTLDAQVPITISGAGKDKTIITGGTQTRQNTAAAFHLIAGKAQPVERAAVENLTVTGFEYGVRVQYGKQIILRDLKISRNHFIGIRLENAADCEVTGCDIIENGKPLEADTGYGLSLLYDSTGNTGSANVYKNNANKNAVDFLERGAEEHSPGNTIELNKIYDIDRVEKPIQDPDNIQPTDRAIRIEMETGKIDGKGAVLGTSTEKVESFTGDGYVFLFNTTITLTVEVPKAGNYRLFVVGASDDGNNKCDFVQINGGTKYLTSYLGKDKGQWSLSQPGSEVWENNELHPKAPDKGFTFKEGKNEILISANWGYCCYDAIILEPIG